MSNEENKLRDMNGNLLREGDLVMVMLDKPFCTGYITSIDVPSILSAGKANPTTGIISVQALVRMAFDPRVMQVMRQVAKVVDPRAEALLAHMMNKSQTGTAAADIKLPSAADLDKVFDEKEAAEKTSGPTLVPSVVEEKTSES